MEFTNDEWSKSILDTYYTTTPWMCPDLQNRHKYINYHLYGDKVGKKCLNVFNTCDRYCHILESYDKLINQYLMNLLAN